jgi:excisionase family DNA binding protein
MDIGSNAKNNLKAYYSPDELAEYLGLSKATVYRLASKGDLPSRKFGRSLKFKIDAIENPETKDRKR